MIRISLKYVDGKVPVVSGLKRISKPGLRVYAAQDRHPARAGRARPRHRQHQPGDHDRQPGPQGPAGRRDPRLRLVASDVTDRPSPHSRSRRRRGRDRRHVGHGPRPEGRARPRGRPPRCASSATAMSCASSAPATTSDRASCTASPGRSSPTWSPASPTATAASWRSRAWATAPRRSATNLQLSLGTATPSRWRRPPGITLRGGATPLASRCSGSTRSWSARWPRASAPPASRSPTRARACATGEIIRRKAGKAGKMAARS